MQDFTVMQMSKVNVKRAIVNQFPYLDNCYLLTIQVMNHFGTLFAVKISPGKQDKYHYLVAIKTTSLQPKENEGTERKAPSPGLGIR